MLVEAFCQKGTCSISINVSSVFPLPLHLVYDDTIVPRLTIKLHQNDQKCEHHTIVCSGISNSGRGQAVDSCMNRIFVVHFQVLLKVRRLRICGRDYKLWREK